MAETIRQNEARHPPYRRPGRRAPGSRQSRRDQRQRIRSDSTAQSGESLWCRDTSITAAPREGIHQRTCAKENRETAQTRIASNDAPRSGGQLAGGVSGLPTRIQDGLAEYRLLLRTLRKADAEPAELPAPEGTPLIHRTRHSPGFLFSATVKYFLTVHPILEQKPEHSACKPIFSRTTKNDPATMPGRSFTATARSPRQPAAPRPSSSSRRPAARCPHSQTSTYAAPRQSMYSTPRADTRPHSRRSRFSRSA